MVLEQVSCHVQNLAGPPSYLVFGVQVILDRHEEMGRAFNVSNCKQFVFIPK